MSDTPQKNTEQQQASIVMLKLSMTAAVAILTGMVFLVFPERSSNEEDPQFITYIFGAMAVINTVMGVWFSQKARRGQPVGVIALAMFEVIALLAFMYVAFLNTEAPLWIMPAVGLYSVAMTWLMVPNNPEKTSNDSNPMIS